MGPKLKLVKGHISLLTEVIYAKVLGNTPPFKAPKVRQRFDYLF